MKLGYIFRIYPNLKQKDYLSIHFGHNRFVWNQFVNLIDHHGYMTYSDMCRHLTHVIKPQYDWLNHAVAQTLQQTLKNLSNGYKSHFRAKNMFEKPKFKKKSTKQSVRFAQGAKVNRTKFASTQICSSCDIQTGPKGTKGLGIKTWKCNFCGSVHDRDLNAAINIGRHGDILYGMSHVA